MRKSLNGNQLKIIAMTAMTLDHAASVTWPDYPTDWWILLIHVIGRLAAPIFWFFVAEGWHYTRNRGKYAGRLFLFAIVGHFAYNFAFGIPFLPFQTSVFNQTSVIWSLAWGLVAPVLDILIYAEPVEKLFAQGLMAAVANIITTGVVGTLLLLGYAKTVVKRGSLEKED